MSIPERLKQAYEQQAESMNPQLEPDSKLLAQFAHHSARQQRRTIVQSRRHTWTRPLFMKIAIGLTVLALVSGFADYMWIRIGDDRVNIQYSEGIDRALDASMLSELHSELEQVRGQLAAGEAALVYSPNIGKLIPEMSEMPYITVSNPIMIQGHDAWKNVLEQEVGTGYKLPPEQSPDTRLTFAGGKREGVYGPDLTSSDMTMLQEMKKQASGTSRLAWRIRPAKQESDPLIRSYTAFYTDGHGNRIDVSLQLAMEQVEMRLIASGAEQSVEVNGGKGVYLRSEPFILSETNQYQTIQWLETHDDVTIIYNVGSASAAVTKEQLLAIAASMSE
ncbi:hypothetical protein PCCS19_33960 [Paenibacillus sp. CCS19]|uniref:hypothetical protein n=1 Tax=Paenibacillus sp. CCS19 TaxID=3158387 RepID=UPI002569A5DE|nr:hypothetical protein [Paenibacillus cellulosilyticus]GMK40340.1 hypothetical protein PCCS19_33960 [Paenibacillus cellulosilyticus]